MCTMAVWISEVQNLKLRPPSREKRLPWNLPRMNHLNLPLGGRHQMC